jgi:putative SOS response-associated peptidase YedK
MCGRYTLHTEKEGLIERFDISILTSKQLHERRSA